ncbi:hypothetical protein [Novosphingobium lentum]|uniref:hypothetical protein n=1 Tax=Novosphingobium lentum TaxID=145287 RepID=UPI00082B2B15|nr:hypothetical protein [Novosphingobium lentum]
MNRLKAVGLAGIALLGGMLGGCGNEQAVRDAALERRLAAAESKADRAQIKADAAAADAAHQTPAEVPEAAVEDDEDAGPPANDPAADLNSNNDLPDTEMPPPPPPAVPDSGGGGGDSPPLHGPAVH